MNAEEECHMSVEISGFEMFVMSAEDIRNLAVAEITSPSCNVEDRICGSLYDARLGASSSGSPCATCHMSGDKCIGHMGFLELAVPVVNPMMYSLTQKHAVEVLQLFCWGCGHLKLTDAARTALEGAESAVVDKARKLYAKSCATKRCAGCALDRCQACEGEKRKCPLCMDKMQAPPCALNGEKVLRFFENLDVRDLDLIGYGGKKHPRRFVWTAFPIMGSVARPVIKMGGDISNDDITKKYSSMVRANADLRAAILQKDSGVARKKKNKSIPDLQRELESIIYSMIVNNKNIKKIFGKDSSKTPCFSLRDRLSGKSGRLRNNLMGKRVDFSARTVVSPDPSLSVGQVGLPRKFARILTVPEIVRVYNKQQLEILVNEGRAKFMIRDGCRKCIEPLLRPKGGYVFSRGDVVIRGHLTLDPRSAVPLKGGDAVRKTNGEVLREPELELPKRRWISLNLGDVVERHIRDGDEVIINRQPTLHGAGMMTHEVRIVEEDTMKLNLAVCAAYNADFDGDEMNVHAPQTMEARAEMSMLGVEARFLAELNGAPMIYPIQDTHLAWYRLTGFGSRPMTRSEWSFVVAEAFPGCGPSEEQLSRAERSLGGMYSGHGVFAMLLPPDFCYDRKLVIAGDSVRVHIENGAVLEGVVQKSLIGKGDDSLLGILAREYSRSLAMSTLDLIQWTARAWLTLHPQSLGPADFFPDSKTASLAKDKVDATLMQAWNLERGGAGEGEIAATLNSARNVGQNIAKQAMGRDNVLKALVDSGAKGNYVNVAQIVGLVGQQSVTAARIEKNISNGERCLTAFPCEAELYRLAEKDPERYMPLLYESRGFVRSSFGSGLSPSEYFFHAQGGRKGLADTAVKTRDSGYIQRRIVKTSEDLRVEHDGTVRNSMGNVIQFSYGHRGLDTAESLRGGMAFVDLERLAVRMRCAPGTRGEALSLSSLEAYLRDLVGSAEGARLELGQWEQPRDLHLRSREAFLSEVSRRYRVSLVSPGKAVGVIMAQSVGEPTTQMVLNTFHMAGVANKKSNMGLQKVKDLTELTNTNRQVCSVHMLEGVSAERVAGMLVKTMLEDVMLGFSRVIRGTKEPWWYSVHFSAGSEEDGFSAEWRSELDKNGKDSSLSMLGMCISLDADALSSVGLVPRDVARALKVGDGNPLVETVIIASPGTIPGVEPCLHIFAPSSVLLSRTDGALDHCGIDVQEWNGYVSVVLRAMRNVSLCGLPGVRSSSLDPDDDLVINLDGSDMSRMFNLHGVYIDFNKTYSDNPKEVASVLGIEAGRRVLMESLKTVIEFDGTKIATAHLELLTDNVSFTGTLLPMTRSGIKNMDASILSKMSFEETPSHIAEGGARNTVDAMQGISARIVAGLPVKMGTGFCTLLPYTPEENTEAENEHEDDEEWLEF